jgi:acyl-[acyl-carrier-protein]-phospholipid O-acyltransferase/long-chain-fatty-acid--[acyl-carrier-protein] ligase
VPKGVVLSHRNMLANAAQAAARIDFGREDKVFNVLPVFHSFGLTVGVVLPLVSGVRIYLYPSPLHYRTVAELIYGVNATIMFGTDTFLAGYARVAHPYDFRSLRYILAGAEPVKETTRRTYMEKFGLRILEGYGVTETAPALALNTPMFNKFGTVGRVLPGMEARLEKVEGVDDGGRLYVRGPNVMLGYLKVDNPGVLEPPAEGWHDTGDIVTIDEQGFITIKGRAKRFAKIGGEMISLAAVEALAAELWPNALSAVVAVPDLRKGERLILLTQQKARRAPIPGFAKAKHASDLMIPSEVWVLDKLPMLGSGKVDTMAAGGWCRSARRQAGNDRARNRMSGRCAGKRVARRRQSVRLACVVLAAGERLGGGQQRDSVPPSSRACAGSSRRADVERRIRAIAMHGIELGRGAIDLQMENIRPVVVAGEVVPSFIWMPRSRLQSA